MVYVKSALKCHTAHTTVFSFLIFLFDFNFFFCTDGAGTWTASWVRGQRSQARRADGNEGGSSQIALGTGRVFPAGTSGSSQVRDTE